MKNRNPDVITFKKVIKPKVEGKIQQLFDSYFNIHKKKKLQNWDCDIMGLEDDIIKLIKQNDKYALIAEGISHFRQKGNKNDNK